MLKLNKINDLKEQLDIENKSEYPNSEKINKLKSQIIILSFELTMTDFKKY
jgi:hypothetical protein